MGTKLLLVYLIFGGICIISLVIGVLLLRGKIETEPPNTLDLNTTEDEGQDANKKLIKQLCVVLGILIIFIVVPYKYRQEIIGLVTALTALFQFRPNGFLANKLRDWFRK